MSSHIKPAPHEEHTEQVDSAVRQILQAANLLSEEIGEARKLNDQIATFWLNLRQVVPIDSDEILREIILINSALLRAQHLGLISRDINLYPN